MWHPRENGRSQQMRVKRKGITLARKGLNERRRRAHPLCLFVLGHLCRGVLILGCDRADPCPRLLEMACRRRLRVLRRPLLRVRLQEGGGVDGKRRKA